MKSKLYVKPEFENLVLVKIEKFLNLLDDVSFIL
jgi:hypothetical protein